MSDTLHTNFPWRQTFAGFRLSTVQVAAVVMLLQVVGELVAAAHGHENRKPLDALGFALVIAGPVMLVWREKAPRLVLSVVLATTLAFYVLGYPLGPAFASLVVAVFTAVMRGEQLYAWSSAIAAMVCFMVLESVVGWGRRPTLTEYIGPVAWILLVLVGCEALRWRRERWAEAERTHHEELRRRAGEDRLRMAQELHDVLAHNISLINVRAGVALHLIDENPHEARVALEAIKHASKDALGELRSVLDILRSDGEPLPNKPAPGVAYLSELTADAVASGLAVETCVQGEARTLSAAVDLATFRIVQEALTNVRRHAKARVARLELTYGEHEVTVSVSDEGSAVQRGLPHAGNGIRGMRERAVALGGRLEAGPRPGGGYQVVAHLPYGFPR